MVGAVTSHVDGCGGVFVFYSQLFRHSFCIASASRQNGVVSLIRPNVLLIIYAEFYFARIIFCAFLIKSPVNQSESDGEKRMRASKSSTVRRQP